MSRIAFIIICATLLVFLFITVNSQKQKKTVTISKNGINLRQVRNGGNRKNIVIKNGNKRRVIVANNKNKNKNNKTKNKGKNKNKGKIIRVSGFLSRQNESLFFNGKKVFISGMNILYTDFGGDFGNGKYLTVKAQFETWLKQISDAGGNAVRILVHGNGSRTPMLDSNGFATGEDTTSLIQELGQFLDTAQKYNIFVFISTWSGAFNMTADKLDVFKNDSKLDRYIEKVLKPLVSALSNKKSLAVWEVINAPQGSVANNIVDSNPCFDTQNLFHQIATFTSNNLTMKDMQRFINKQLDAIKIADPKVLRSVVSKEEEASEFCDWCYNYWQHKCLEAAGGKPNGLMDIHEFDAVAFAGYDYYWSPVKKKASDFKFGKPIIIAMASGNCSDSKSGVTIFNNAISWGYAGVFGWRYAAVGSLKCIDSPAQSDAAMSAIRNNDLVKISM